MQGRKRRCPRVLAGSDPPVVVACLFQYHATRVFSSVHYAAAIVEVPFRANRKPRQLVFFLLCFALGVWVLAPACFYTHPNF